MDKPLKAYLCSHRGVYLSAYTLVFAPDQATARRKLLRLIDAQRLRREAIEIREIPIAVGATLIWNGDY